MCTPDMFLGFLAILFPPLAVWIKCGLCSADSVINILLCMLGYIPGLLHAWYIIAKYPETYEYDALAADEEQAGGSRVTYVFVQEQPPAPHPRPQSKPAHAQASYGATDTNAHNNADSSSSAGPANHDGHAPPPPTYAEAVKGDHKIQTQD